MRWAVSSSPLILPVTSSAWAADAIAANATAAAVNALHLM
jgi:hypothetical protein